MKLKFTAALCALLIASAAGAFAAQNIGTAKAKAIALKHAEVAESQAKFKEAKLDTEHGTAKYEVEFYAKGQKFDYEINAETGKIMKFSREAKDQSKAGSGTSETYKPAEGSKEYIGEAKAKAAVLAKLPGAKESDIREFKLDKEKGRMVYEGEVRTGAVKYEFKIDAKSGEFVEWKQD